MKRVSFALFLALFAIASADEWKLPTEQPDFKAGSGADLVTANCLMCHSSEYITTQPAFTADQWKASVTKMQQKYGAPVTDAAMQPLVDYLTANYGKAAAK
jgi:mono/diheme cytochrome c family protein